MTTTSIKLRSTTTRDENTIEGAKIPKQQDADCEPAAITTKKKLETLPKLQINEIPIVKQLMNASERKLETLIEQQTGR